MHTERILLNNSLYIYTHIYMCVCVHIPVIINFYVISSFLGCASSVPYRVYTLMFKLPLLGKFLFYISKAALWTVEGAQTLKSKVILE